MSCKNNCSHFGTKPWTESFLCEIMCVLKYVRYEAHTVSILVEVWFFRAQKKWGTGHNIHMNKHVRTYVLTINRFRWFKFKSEWKFHWAQRWGDGVCGIKICSYDFVICKNFEEILVAKTTYLNPVESTEFSFTFTPSYTDSNGALPKHFTC